MNTRQQKKYLSVTMILIISLLTLLSCSAINTEQKTGYDLNNPDMVLVMPDTLREISGLAILDSTTFACIQDENGILFIYDISKNKIVNQYTFHIDGDYEGISKVNSTLYILRSDGTLFEIYDFQKNNFDLKYYTTGIPANNNEGLCYDKNNKRLLIACKGKIGKGPEYKDSRVIYGFDLQKKVLTSEPVYDFDLRLIKEFVVINKINIPTKTRKKKGMQIEEPFIKFRTSAIGIHPYTKQLYVLSASDYLLFIFDNNGTIEHIEQLNHKLFNKAEGISFFRNGDMLITNEGQDKKPTLLRFNYIRK